MKKIFTAILCLSFIIVRAQQTAIQKTIAGLETKGTIFRAFTPFAAQGVRQTAQLGTYTALQANRIAITELYTTKPEQIDVSLPVDGTVWQLRFTRSHILSDTKFVIADANGERTDTSYIPGVFYHGIIKNVSGSSFATASVFNGTIRLFVSYNGKNIQAGPVDDESPNSTEYGSFSRLPGNNEPFPFECGTRDNANAATVTPALNNPVIANSATGNKMDAYTGRVIRVFFDCSFAYYQHYSSSTAVCFNRITTLFNQTALCYANESINTAISQIRVWTSTDPYNHANRNVGLATFKNSVRNAYTGNIAMLCDWQPTFNSGLADGIGVLCQAWVNAATPGPYIYNDLNYNNIYYNFPVAADAPQTYLFIHEMGHILGSAHTQWCGWSGGPIDNCAAVEGSCSPGPTPSQGTMMSYCCTSSIGISFNAGFGTQPGNAIRNHINAVACLSNGASICDSSLYLQGSITNSDYTTFEVSNTLTARTTLSISANVVFDGGRQVNLMPGFLAPQGSLFRVVNEGCGGIYRQGSTAPPKE